MNDKVGLLERLQTYGVVTIITALIWLCAESENVQLYDGEPLDVMVVPANEQLVLEKREPQRVLISFTSTRRQYEEIKKLAQSSPIRLQVTDDPNRPEQTIILSDRLNEQKAFEDLGVVIKQTQPKALNVRVERLVTEEVPIAVVAGALQLQGAAVVQPPKARVRLPSSLADTVKDLQLEARLDTIEDADRLEVNVLYDREVRLALPEQLRRPNVSVEPESVKVSFTIRKLTKEVTLPRVAITIEAPLAQLSEYTVKLADEQVFVRDVKLSGPNDLIEKIEKGEIAITAVLKLSATELDSDITSKLLYISKPDQVQVISELPRVNFKIMKNP